MRKHFLFLFLALLLSLVVEAQVKTTKVGYIDMEYILQNVPNYTEAKNQLEQKAQAWKQEIETRNSAITKLKDGLKTERALLTKELIEERETEIKFLENDVQAYQQAKFGPNGDLFLQKTALTKPIQDQVFNTIQDIAEAKKYDFIFDKSSDLTILFAAKRLDISDLVINALTRTDKRQQLSKKELAAQEAKENKEDALLTPVSESRQKALDDKKAARDLIIAERLLQQEAKKKEADDKRKQIIADREAKKTGVTAPTSTTEKQTTTPSDKTTTEETKKIGTVSETTAKTTAENTAAVKTEAKIAAEQAKAKTAEDRKKILEERRKALEEKRKKTLEEREAAKKAATEKTKEN